MYHRRDVCVVVHAMWGDVSRVNCIKCILAEYPSFIPHQHVGRYLRVFCNLVLVHGAVIPLAKRTLLEMLQNPEWGRLLCRYEGSAGMEKFERELILFGFGSEDCKAAELFCSPHAGFGGGAGSSSENASWNVL